MGRGDGSRKMRQKEGQRAKKARLQRQADAVADDRGNSVPVDMGKKPSPKPWVATPTPSKSPVFKPVQPAVQPTHLGSNNGNGAKKVGRWRLDGKAWRCICTGALAHDHRPATKTCPHCHCVRPADADRPRPAEAELPRGLWYTTGRFWDCTACGKQDIPYPAVKICTCGRCQAPVL